MSDCLDIPLEYNPSSSPPRSIDDTGSASDALEVRLIPDEPPDGGKGWLVVFGSTLALFATTGVINAYGVFQSYYTKVLLTQSTSTTIALIGALQISLVYAGGPITGKLFDVYGLNILLPLGSLLVVLSLVLVSFCKANQPYQFFLVQGVLSGIGNSLIFTPALAVMGHWFQKRRAYALGIVVAGSSLGGVVYPIMLQHLMNRFDFAWAVRISSFVTLGCLIVANLTIQTRIRRTKGNKINFSTIIDLNGFNDICYTLATVSSFLYFYALFIPYFYIEEYAVYNGVSPVIASYLLAIINGCGIPSRIIPGFLGDRFGVLQILVPSTILSGGVVLAIWLPAKGDIPIVLFSALYGLFSSSFVSMIPAYVATITPVESFGARLGTLYFFVAVACLAGTPTAGAFVPKFTEQNFSSLIIFTGVILLSAAALMGVAYWITLRRQRKDNPDLASRGVTRTCTLGL
ncbi:monocarboxylate permease [Hysterangium stoloniferum]|nr:monocarboxylate permease [Hysterangium stoloniferum]